MNVAPVHCAHGVCGHNQCGYDNCNRNEYNASDIRHDIVEVQSQLKDTITALSDKQSAGMSDLHNRLCASEKENIKAGYEGRLETKQSTKETNDKVALESEKTRVQLHEFERSVNDKFCHTNDHISNVERRIDAKFAGLREQHLELRNQELRDELLRCQICKCASPTTPSGK
jgi:hypothetical protein